MWEASRKTSLTAAAARRFLVVQAVFVVYVVAEMIIALVVPLRATENTSSIGMKGDTAVTAPWPYTLVWAIFIALAFMLRRPIARGAFAFLASLYAISITAGNGGTMFGTHHFSGWRWDLVVALDAVAAVLTVVCVLAALAWASHAMNARRSARVVEGTDSASLNAT
jgi:hypothetical protein